MNAFVEKNFQRWNRLTAVTSVYLGALVLLCMRLYVGHFFWQSGQTKIVNLDNARQLFEFEYIPNWEKNSVKSLFDVDITFPVPSAELAAPLATYGEIILSALLIAGFAGRFAALGIFMMALVIETFVYPGTDEHFYWMLCMGSVMAFGSGKISVDQILHSLVSCQCKKRQSA